MSAMSHLLNFEAKTFEKKSIKLIEEHEGFGHLVGTSDVMKNVYYAIKRVAPTKASVFITGESGTGKELVARTIHDISTRANGPFIAINCGAITPELIVSALFGHERGSFTGANQSHQGYFEQASGGTLFLDELPETSTDIQVKLLRVLETGTVIPVGGKRQISVDVRVIVATNRNPFDAIKEGSLREDIFYRLSTFPIYIPPLRERDSDVAHLANYFLKIFNEESNYNLKFTKRAIAYLESLSWPGNVREMKNCIQRAFILADDEIDVVHLQSPNYITPKNSDEKQMFSFPLGESLAALEKAYIDASLRYHDNDVIKVAKLLGVNKRKISASQKE